ncbi:MAG: MBL fold metallo-hydrolase [Cytophagales bacterium]|nr:MAG: MBL fold metallo-hydrolase [Cytophagales bacterium]TAF62141.1 MAG: MBL fold metallo-hydrolase [Cytophagales bacterium]
MSDNNKKTILPAPLVNSKIRKIKVSNGIFWIEIPEAHIYLLCGCPADTVKHLKKRGLVEGQVSNGVTYESGPNAILLSDVLIQNGSFSNLTEFPVLQMLYLQGMIIPNHPNNTGIKPMLIGLEEQVRAQMEYIFRGNYGLVSKEEIMATGVNEQMAEEMMRIKLNFAFGKISPSDVLLDKRFVNNKPVELRNGVFVKRLGLNKYEINYQNETAEVDLSLQPNEKYEAPYQLGFHTVKREYLAVVHSGEGDGWDIHRPCMAAVLIFQGKVYLIDAGPNISATLNYLGISMNEIEGIFHTHAHDDHFAGLTTLIRTDRKFKYFATPLVRSAVTKKLCALMSIKEEHFASFFDIQDLEFDKWNHVEGLEVMPSYSPHPVETSIFSFRVLWDGEYKTYSHLADIVALNVFNKMVANDVGISIERFKKVKEAYLQPADLKKIDIGGGLIHGDHEDFRYDRSQKIILAHTHKPLTMSQREIGSSSAFGMTDVLIPATRDHLVDFARAHLNFYFPDAPEYEISYLLNHPIRFINAGSMIYRKGQVNKLVYLLLTGSVEFTDSQSGGMHTFSAGSLIGFYSGFLGMDALETYWAASNIAALELPSEAYHDFVARNGLYDQLRLLESNIVFLETTWLFGEVVSFPILSAIAQKMKQLEVRSGQYVPMNQEECLYLIVRGEVEVIYEEKRIAKLKKTDFFGTDTILFGTQSVCRFMATKDTILYTINAESIVSIPVVYWKLIETYEKRLRRMRRKDD